MAPNGIITTYAGTGVACSVVAGPGCGDGGPALQADLAQPWRLALGPDGSLYVIEWSVDRVRRIAPDGTITHFAGGTGSDLGDGGPASLATLYYPSGLAIGPDGSVYIGDEMHARVRRAGPDGIMRTVAGSGQSCDPANDPDPTCGDGGAALSARLGKPVGLAVASDGSVFIADSWVNRVRKVSPDGIITGMAGTGDACDEATDPTCGDGALALKAAFTAPINLALDAHGGLYVVEDTGCRIRRLRSPLTGTSLTDVVVPSADAGELWVFDSRGRHQRTLDPLTGSVQLTFAYDGEGRLTSLADPFNNTVTVERVAGGAPSALIAPYGQRTSLALDPNGYLANVTDPLGQTVQLVHGGDGLLTQMTDGRGGVHQFEFDDRGRLTKDTDPAGNTQTLDRTQTSTGWQVSIRSAEGRTTRHLTETLATGEEQRRITLPGGQQTRASRWLDGTSSITYADGTQKSSTAGPDPRFGMSAPEAVASTLRTPGGLSLDATATSTAVLANPLDLLSLQSLTQTAVVNGRTSIAQYVAATRQWTYTSPTGRQQTLMLDANGRVIQAEPLRGVWPVQVAYDGRGRLATVTQGSGPSARTAQLGYDAGGELATITDALGRQTSFVRDAAGRVVQQTLPDGRVIATAYDANSNVTAVTPPARPAHTFSYTPVDLEASYVPPDVGGPTTTTFGYNGDRQLTGMTRPDGTSVALAYDAAGRLATLTLPRGAVTFAYDSTTGSLTRTTAPDGGHLDFMYDGALLTGMTLTGTVSGNLQWTFNNDLRVAAESCNGDAIAFGYDDDGSMVQAGELAIARDALNGLPTGTTLGGVATSLGVDAFGDLTTYGAQYNSGALLAATYIRDQLGRITSRSETIGGTTTSFGYAYDTVGRLTQVTANGTPTETYAYDANGNRQGCTVDAQDRLTACGATTYGYTANGDLRTKTAGGQTTTFDYDADGALRSVTLADGRRIDYVLDSFGRRIGKKADGVLVQGLIYRDRLRPVAELDGSGNLVARFVYAGGSTPSYLVKGGATYRILTDHVGSPRLVVDVATGDIAQRLDYDAFGRVLSDTNPGFQPFGFAGGVYDSDTALVRFGARDYDAETGRWTAKDPIKFGGRNPNLYGYVLSDPVNYSDPRGLRILAKTQAEWEAIQEMQLNPNLGPLLDELEQGRDIHVVEVPSLDEPLAMAGGAQAVPGRKVGAIRYHWCTLQAGYQAMGWTLKKPRMLSHEFGHIYGCWMRGDCYGSPGNTMWSLEFDNALSSGDFRTFHDPPMCVPPCP